MQYDKVFKFEIVRWIPNRRDEDEMRGQHVV